MWIMSESLEAVQRENHEKQQWKAEKIHPKILRIRQWRFWKLICDLFICLNKYFSIDFKDLVLTNDKLSMNQYS